MFYPYMGPEVSPEERKKLTEDRRVERAVLFTKRALEELEAVHEVDVITTDARKFLKDELIAQRDRDKEAAGKLPADQAYVLGMRGAFVVLDKVQASVEYETPAGTEATLIGGLASMFDEINN